MGINTVLFGVAVCAAVAYLPLSSRTSSTRKTLIKTIPLPLFALIAILAHAPWLLVIGLGLSAFGDFALSREGESAFMAGLMGFGAAHLAYIALFLPLGGGLDLAFELAPLPAIALLVMAISTEFWLAPHTGALRWAVRCYVVLITVMGLAAFALPAQYHLATVGAGLFVLSDLILSVQLFRLAPTSAVKRPAGWLLWVLYVAGQAFILAAFVPLSLP
ncbi:lysoplasmalogenase [Actibacterium lipolyticum]|uniref:YhhN-like protein n=1 Tax=Actibacterium lipolyticum TaxID=1524263 RepID=A0A238KMH8_9RHOB|nr:lysoplasmalogenase [Actibacterium lipolyticum]SMX43342.1 YhhN-like protein [Actibacterium lipolyticum]